MGAFHEPVQPLAVKQLLDIFKGEYLGLRAYSRDFKGLRGSVSHIDFMRSNGVTSIVLVVCCWFKLSPYEKAHVGGGESVGG